MHGGGPGFFRELSGDRIDDRVFEVAYFWRLDPAAVMLLPLSRFSQYEAQAQRLAKSMRPEDG